MRFDLLDFAVFDIHLLRREDAAKDYPPDLVAAAAERHDRSTPTVQTNLIKNIVAGLPGSNDKWGLGGVREQLRKYDGIGPDQLRANLIAFLQAVVPTAERFGLRLCCHPDDPPFSLMGLPRIMSTPADYAQIMRAVDSPANGITLCTGSMGVAEGVDFVKFIQDWGHRIHFVHLRNTTREGPTIGGKHTFFEDAHLEGDTDMVSVIRALMDEQLERWAQGREDPVIPMRPDHGHELLDDLTKNSMPGYPLIGRMRGLAELRGIMAALS